MHARCPLRPLLCVVSLFFCLFPFVPIFRGAGQFPLFLFLLGDQRATKSHGCARRSASASTAAKAEKASTASTSAKADKADKADKAEKAATSKAASKAANKAAKARSSSTRDIQGEQGDGADASATEFEVRKLLDVAYMFSENVDHSCAIFPRGTDPVARSSRGRVLTYALHAKIEWEGVDSKGDPYEPTWEVMDADMMDSMAWRDFVAEKRRVLRAEQWSVDDIAFESAPHLGNRVQVPAIRG